MNSKIFIASKGRAGNSHIISEINELGIEYYLFIEPNEISDYKKYYNNAIIINIDYNNMGLPYVRNFMLNYAIQNNIELYWNLDDDVKLYSVINNKCIKSNINILFEAEKYFINDLSIAQAGLEYMQFAWSANKEFNINSYCDCVVAIKTELCKNLIFDEKALLKLDRDFSMQVIKNGYKTMKINSFAFSCPKNGSNKGGLFDIYQTGIEKENVNYMVKKWGNSICMPIIKPNGRNDVKILWNKINSKQINLF